MLGKYYICSISKSCDVTPQQFKFFSENNDTLRYKMSNSAFTLNSESHIFCSNLITREQAVVAIDVVKGMFGADHVFAGAVGKDYSYNGPVVQEDIIRRRVMVEKYGPGTIMAIESVRSVRFGVKLDTMPDIFENWFKTYKTYPYFWESDLSFDDSI